MILDQETLEKFGYLASGLSKGSNKSILTRCDYCGSQIKTTMKVRNKLCAIVNKDCCAKCKAKKREEICLLEHGVRNQFQRDEIKNKIKESNQEKYGVDYFTQTAEFKEKAETTMMDRFGVTHSSQSKELCDKRTQTMVDRYGMENASQVEEFQEKRKQTNLERFGAEQFLKSDYAKEKVATTIQERYGVGNVFQNEDIKKKIKQSCIDKYGVDHYLKIKENARIASEKSIAERIRRGSIKLYDGKPLHEYKNEIQYSMAHFYKLIKQYGFEQARYMTPKISSLEQIIGNWLDTIGINYQHQVKFDGFIADFVLPDHNIVIECDGLYWHSEIQQKDKEYHRKKKEVYKGAGYTALFFREDELINSFPIIQSIILNKCGLCPTRLYARKCEHTSEVDKEFFIDNHLMGKGKGQIFGLKYENKVVAAIQVKRIKDQEYEISRFCTAIGVSLVGGFTKLLKRAISELDPSSVITFIDCRYGSGEYLPSLGFEYINTHLSFRWTDTDHTFHRLNFPSNTGYDKGLFKIYDCGQSKYILKL